jgi:hypothetical protein
MSVDQAGMEIRDNSDFLSVRFALEASNWQSSRSN